MKKMIIVLAIVILTVCVLLTACKTKKDNGETATTTAGRAQITEIETFTDPDTGESYVTNKDGEHIPITTGIDGSLELYDELQTKTGAQVSQEASEIESKKQEMTSAPTTASTPDNTQPADDTTTDSGDIFDEDHAAIIDWP